MGDDTKVDLLTLEAFRSRLDTRLAEAQSVLDTLHTKLRSTTPALGQFQDAGAVARRCAQVHAFHVQRAGRLINAISAARAATDEIVRNYRTTEARNEANAAQIADALGGVDAALKGGSQHG
ncbi:MAG TPA: hypothetical protein VK453_01905 [Micromonosporaceae bacterium]|nr:hypothetical protein [Micromonosporaceae bacterium]